MSVKEIIDSGILEMYCLGIASDDEKALIEKLIVSENELQKELGEINTALARYASDFRKEAMPSLKQRILEQIELSPQEPEQLSENSSIVEWLNYVDHLGLKPSTNIEGLDVRELPQRSTHLTMVLWGTKGAIIPDEEHEAIDEHFLICKGACEMTIDGVKTIYGEGGYLCIHPHHIHSGVVISDEPMMLIVQRRAASFSN